jgi:hypothetical protein
MATLALLHLRKQKYQKWIIHRKLRVPMSEREGKLSNPRARRARDAWRKFTEIYGNPRMGAAHTLCIDVLATAYTVMSGRRTVFFNNFRSPTPHKFVTVIIIIALKAV